jgi:wyosine [tRNA(Phe)-imidazoG37] synthetase (radical SAM superfamily)
MMTADRQPFYTPNEITIQAKNRLDQLKQTGVEADYLTFVPNGEPTLDATIGEEIGLLKKYGKRIAVITNSSLLWREDVRRELAGADTVSVKIDTATPDTWKRINRPHKFLDLDAILQGILRFREVFEGDLLTETMLVKGINDSLQEIEKTADFVALVEPEVAYLSVPTRPPAENYATPAGEQALSQAYHLFSSKIAKVEYLIGYEGNAFASTGDIKQDILSITAVHPLREEAVTSLLEREGAAWQDVEQLVEGGSLITTQYQGHRYYMRKPVSLAS